MKTTVWYFPEGDVILIREKGKGYTHWECGETGIYWTYILDEADSFVYLGVL